MTLYWVYLLAPALIAAAAIALLAGSPWGRTLTDRPNERSLHEHPTPRVGGLGVMLASLPFLAAAGFAQGAAIAACAAFLAVVSALDDARPLPVEVRLPAHAAAAVVTVLALGDATLGGWGWPVAIELVLAFAWMTNLFNFMDGSDGLAGGMAVIGFGTYAIAAHVAGATALALACIALASAAGGFLLHNFPPARVFLGDAGSIPLGFLAAALALVGVLLDAWPAWFPVLVFSPFIVDASVTLLRRLAAGKRVLSAHREHAYQRLVLAGWTRVRLAMWAYALMGAAAASAFVALRGGAETRYAIILAWFAIYPALYLAIERRTREPAAA